MKTREYRGAGDPLLHVFFKQSVRGIDVFGAALRVHMRADGSVVEVSNSTARVRNLAQAGVSGPDAVAAAIRDVRPELAIAPVVLDGPAGADRLTRFARGPLKSASKRGSSSSRCRVGERDWPGRSSSCRRGCRRNTKC